MQNHFSALSAKLKGSIHTDQLTRTLYATDASVYKELPTAVAYPKDEEDIITLVRFAKELQIPLIPRTAGTSLAGQCVGNGVVVDVSRHMTKILELDESKGVVRVQPGVIRDELNDYLRPHGWFFGPNTSTANRCMIGGMAGNNSCGSTSIRYGSTRDKTLKIRAVTASAEVVEFLENGQTHYDIQLQNLLQPQEIREEIAREFPKSNIHRRNTGYAIDILANQQPFAPSGEVWNAAKLLCGSEGTLAFTTEITLQLDPLPPSNLLVIAAHFSSIRSCMEATRIAMTFEPYACELMDKIILDCTKENIEQRENRFFVQDDPAAILAIELRHENANELEKLALALIDALENVKLGFAFPIIRGDDVAKVWNLRAAGLGLLANIPGPKKALACIEDTAVDLQDLPDYISEFEELMKGFGQQAVYYAHAGAGELHLRPILDLRNKADLEQFRQISEASARLVKKYRGSLSGEHGDGRVRAEFIPIMIGEKNYALLREVKNIFDPHHLFNPGKIIDAPPMDTMLREDPERPLKKINTFFDYGKDGFLAATEKCNGSGDCRKLASSGGTMCPSYQATREEKHTTRGRANALREFISNASEGKNAFAHEELKEVLDLCLSCKGCTRECPSNVDMAGMKAEFQYQYYKSNTRPLRDLALGHIDIISKPAGVVPKLVNGFNRLPGVQSIIKRVLGIAPQRNLPAFQAPLHRWFDKNVIIPKKPRGSLYFFFDEFTNYQDVEVGKAAIALLWRLGYEVKRVKHASSGRSQISKGLLDSARKRADKNVEVFFPIASKDTPVIGIEPSAILSFRDEYPRLVSPELREKAENLKQHVFLIDEFLAHELRSGNVHSEDFGAPKKAKVLLHGHCHQKALSGLGYTKDVLKAAGYTPEIIPSGCCGMAGSFGYEKEHYHTSMDIGELVLFPKIRETDVEQIIVAPGTSCRHQIADGTGRIAKHWVEII